MIIRACPELEVEMLADTQGCTGRLEVRALHEYSVAYGYWLLTALTPSLGLDPHGFAIHDGPQH